MAALGLAALAAVVVWCVVVVVPAMVLSGRLSELERSGDIETALWRSGMVRPDGDEQVIDGGNDDEG